MPKIQFIDDTISFVQVINGTRQRVPVGVSFDVANVPAHWLPHITVVADAEPEAVFVANPAEDDIEELRADYAELAGEEPDKRWSAKTLRDKLEAMANG